MPMKIAHFNSVEAAKLLNVNVSTIKRWTDEGILECVKTAGGHRKFTLIQLAKFLRQKRSQVSSASLFPVEIQEDVVVGYQVLKGDYEHLISYLLKHAMSCDRSQVYGVLSGLYMADFPLHEIYDQLLAPVLYRIGDSYHSEEITITQEHFATQTIRDSIIRLQGIVPVPEAKKGKAFCLLMSTEMHDLALKMVDHLLETFGYKVFFSGQMTPSIRIEKIFEQIQPDFIFISSTFINDLNTAQAEFDKICYVSAEHRAEVYIGGQGFDLLEHHHPIVKQRFYFFQELSDAFMKSS